MKSPNINAVYRKFKTFNIGKAAGLDQIPCKLLIIAAEVVAPSPTQIFDKIVDQSINRSIDQSINRPIDQSTNRPIDQPIDKSSNQASSNRPATTSRPADQLWPSNQSINAIYLTKVKSSVTKVYDTYLTQINLK